MIGNILKFNKFIALALLLNIPLFATAADTPEPAADPLRQAAQNNDAAAQIQLAGEFFYGKNRAKNLTLAFYWYKQAADNGNTAAQYNVGKCYESGSGVTKNLYLALKYYQLSAPKLAASRFQQALLLRNGIKAETIDALYYPEVKADPEAAQEIIRQLAENDHFIPAQREMALEVLERRSKLPTPQELQIAIALLQQAAAGNDPTAIRKLADCYRIGFGVEIDLKKMFELLQQGAAANDSESIGKLAHAYERGLGTEIDLAMAQKLYMQAAENNDPMAQYKLGCLLKTGTDTLPQDEAAALECFKISARQGYPPALQKLYEYYRQKNEAEASGQAAKYLLIGANTGEPELEKLMGLELIKGELFPRNEEKGFEWINRAARQGNASAQRELAYCYYNGIGVEQDDQAGLRWSKAAAANGDETSRKLLKDL
ncbi:MAG: SEL1-like repeat protein [Victivallaceae bacterium]